MWKASWLSVPPRCAVEVGVLPLLLFLTVSVAAQDPILTQFFNTPVYSNPAYVGQDGGIVVSTAYRRQWNEIPGGFNTAYVSVESLENCAPLAVGLQLLRDVEGEGMLQTTTASIPIAGVLAFGTRQRPVNIRLAFSPFYTTKQVDWDRLVFSDQLDNLNGNVLPSQFNEGGNGPVNFGGVNLGALLRWDKPTKWKESMEFEVGFAVHNALNFNLNSGPTESLLGIGTNLPTRFVAHFGMYAPFFRLGSKLDVFRFVPQVRYERQGGLDVSTMGFLGYYQGASIGLFYTNRNPVAGFQNTDALTGYIGFGWNLDRRQAIDIGLSYDINVGGLRTMTGGTFELTAKYSIQSNGLLCGLIRAGQNGFGNGNRIQCPSLGRAHRKRWEGIWYK